MDNHTLLRKYDESAAVYRELWAPHLRVAGRRLLEEISPAGVERVLEVGCGVGMLLEDLREAFPSARLLGTDRSAGMLGQALRGLARVRMDARQLALASSTVDVVIQNFMLFHLEEPVDGLRESRRVLRQGGCAGVATWGIEKSSEAEDVWSECLDAHGADTPDPITLSRHDLVDTPDKMDTLFHEAGFAHIRSWLGNLEYELTVDEFLRLRVNLGRTRPRYDSLSSQAQASCVAETRGRLETLPPGKLMSRIQVVYTVGEAI